MSARHAVWTAVHWAACTITALLFVEGLPFTGLHATATAAVIAAAVGLLGLAVAPHTNRKDGRP